MSVGFEQSQYEVNEGAGSVRVCLVKNSTTAVDVLVEVEDVPDSASRPEGATCMKLQFIQLWCIVPVQSLHSRIYIYTVYMFTRTMLHCVGEW